MAANEGDKKEHMEEHKERHGDKEEGESEWDAATLWQRFSFAVASPLLALGETRVLEFADLYRVPRHDRAGRQTERLRVAFVDVGRTETRNDGDGRVARERANGRRMMRLLKALCLCNAQEIYAIFLWAFTESGTRIGQPVVLGFLLDWLEREGPLWEGIMLAGILCALSVVQSVVHHVAFYFTQRMGWNVRTACSGLIQHRLLGLSTTTLGTHTTTGQIVSLLANDARRFDEACLMASFFFTAPVDAVVITVLIALQLGWLPAIVGVMSVLLVIPIQLRLAHSFATYRQQTADSSDDRIRHTAEVIEGIGSIKAFAWESAILNLIHTKRDRETGWITKAQRIKSISATMGVASPVVASFVTFAVFNASGEDFSVANAFSVIALIQVLRMSIAELWVRSVEAFTEAFVSLKRIQRFLELTELPPEQADCDYQRQQVQNEQQQQGEEDGDGDIELADQSNSNSNSNSNSSDGHLTEHDRPKAGSVVYVPPRASFFWRHPQQPVLREIGLHCEPGELLMVIGPVGAGKTSLLMALLGEVSYNDPSAKHSGAPSGPAEEETEIATNPFIRPGARVAFCGQSPWIRSCSIRENIVYAAAAGAEGDERGTSNGAFDEALYNEVLDACALRADLEQWPNGDRTEIGERGVNMSGGQKARVALARAVYADADVYLLDDPLSAVDSAVSKVLLQKCIQKLLCARGKCVILVSHQLQYVAAATRVLCLDRHGQCIAHDTAHSLVARNVNLSGLVESVQADTNLRRRPSGSSSGISGLTSEASKQQRPPPGQATTVAASLPSMSGADDDGGDEPPVDVGGDSKPWSAFAQIVAENDADAEEAAEGEETEEIEVGGNDPSHQAVANVADVAVEELAGGGTAGGNGGLNQVAAAETDIVKVVEAEERVQGQVTFATYGTYLRSGGPILGCIVMVLMVCGQACVIASDYWLGGVVANASDQQRPIYIIVFACLVGATILIGIARAVAFFHFCLTAATALHDAAISAVVHSPLAFFVANPTGRILNKFSKDQGSVDELLPVSFYNFAAFGLFCLGAVALVCASVPWLILLFLPLTYAFYKVRKKFLASSREIKRMEGIYKSPVYNEFSATIHGLVSIRAFALQSRVQTSFLAILDNYGRAWYSFLVTNRWLGFRLDMISSTLLIFMCVCVIALRSTVDPALVGLALAYTISLSGVFQWTVRQSAEVENNLTSVERINHYGSLPPEPGYALDTADTDADGADGAGGGGGGGGGGGESSADWPSIGTLDLRHVQVRYREDLEPVIHDLNVQLPGGSKIGVVGRTGSGKSSLLQALLRLNQLCGGEILLDGVPLSRLGLRAGRRVISLIPQEPHLFTGTVRFNLDPFGLYEDEKIWAALEDAQLKTAIAENPQGLGAEVTEHGSNWSVGQRQLLSLARAILRGNKVVLMDEATANVDYHTDSLIQQAIRSSPALVSSTIITVAHRLRTVMDSDLIMVLADGALAEFDTPWNLLQDHGSAFYRMVKHTGQMESLRKIAEEKHKTPSTLLSSLAVATTEDEKTAML